MEVRTVTWCNFVLKILLILIRTQVQPLKRAHQAINSDMYDSSAVTRRKVTVRSRLKLKPQKARPRRNVWRQAGRDGALSRLNNCTIGASPSMVVSTYKQKRRALSKALNKSRHSQTTPTARINRIRSQPWLLVAKGANQPKPRKFKSTTLIAITWPIRKKLTQRLANFPCYRSLWVRTLCIHRSKQTKETKTRNSRLLSGSKQFETRFRRSRTAWRRFLQNSTIWITTKLAI